MKPIERESRPALAHGVRSQTDRLTGEPVLLAPEGIVVLNDTAQAIVARCNGQATVAEIVAALAEEYDAPPEELFPDVIECLVDLREKSLIVLS